MSLVRKRFGALMAGSAVVLGLTFGSSFAQDASKKTTEFQGSTVKKAEPPTDPAETKETGKRPTLPRYFGQIALTPQQRERINQIQARRQAEVVALEKQIEQLKAKALTDCEGVLTDVQKQLLSDLRKAAKEKS